MNGTKRLKVRVDFQPFDVSASTAVVVVKLPPNALEQGGAGVLQPLADQLTGILQQVWARGPMATATPPMVVFARNDSPVHFEQLDEAVMRSYGWAPVAKAGRVAGELRQMSAWLREVDAGRLAADPDQLAAVADLIDAAVGPDPALEGLPS